MNDNYGEQIKRYRINLGMTQNQVATELDVTPGYISNVENGRTAMSLRLLIYYAKLMGITLDELVGRHDLLKMDDTYAPAIKGKVVLDKILNNDYVYEPVSYKEKKLYDFELEKTKDEKVLIRCSL